MAFIETADYQERINITDIVRLRDGEKQNTVAELRNGRTVNLAFGADVVAQASCQFIPAYPGFELLEAGCDGDEMFFHRQPIIGWRMEWYGPEPVVPDCEGHYVTKGNHQAIKYPDGQVLRPSHRDYPNEAEWRAEIERELVSEQRREKAALKVVTKAD